MKHLDFWIPMVGLLLASAGLAALLAYVVCRNKKPEPDPIPLPALPFNGKCGVCGVEHGSNAAWDGDLRACVTALLALVPKRGDHGRFTKR